MKGLRVLAFFLLSLFFFSASPSPWSLGVVKYAKAAAFLKENAFRSERTDKTMAYAALRGMLSALDPHSYLLDPDSFQTMKEDQEGKFYGIGVQILQIQERLTVVAPLEGTPAFRMGIQAGDVIVEVDGKSTKSGPQQELLRKLRGPKGSVVRLAVVREGLKAPIHFTLEREEIPLHSVSYSFGIPFSKKKLGLVVVRGFTSVTVEEFDKAMEKLSGNSLQGLVLDLRYNEGGDLSQAVALADRFLEKGKLIVSIKGREKSMNRSYKAEKSDPWEQLPLVILVNRGSASASEIVAGALQDQGRAVVVGSRTWGKGLVQTIFYLKEDVAMALTTARYYTPSGRVIQRDYTHLEDYLLFYEEKGNGDRGGIVPDYTVGALSYGPLTAQWRGKGLFFAYANSLFKRQLPLSLRFSVDSPRRRFFLDKRGIPFLAPLPEEIGNDFLGYLKGKGVAVEGAQAERERPFWTVELKREIVSRYSGQEEGIAAVSDKDPQLVKAVEILEGERGG